ncbi:MAG: GNAT family N-acetyltransferase [Candidatus Hatepunaea meridiana]|nr:GNAT family N-acetyltransferase [Candidatus Hatepunaea meridiana]
MNYRNYNPEKDKKAVNRIWQEIGWIEKDNPKPMDILIESARAIVADINNEPECLVISLPGDIDYLGEKLSFSGIAGVTTSLIARKQHLAGRLTATRIALDATEGALVSGLGMFEQGYYDKLGYGTGPYEHIIRFSPSSLNIDIKPRVPSRITKEDWQQVHQSRLKRLRTL